MDTNLVNLATDSDIENWERRQLRTGVFEPTSDELRVLAHYYLNNIYDLWYDSEAHGQFQSGAREVFAHRRLKTIESFQHTLENRPAALAWFLCALDYLEGPAREIVIAGPNPEPLLRAVRGPFLPNKVLAYADGKTSIPLLEGRKAIDGKAAAYVCESFTCKRPVSTPEELSKLLKE